MSHSVNRAVWEQGPRDQVTRDQGNATLRSLGAKNPLNSISNLIDYATRELAR